MGPKVATGVFGKDVTDVILGLIFPHESGERRCFAGVVHVAIENDAGICVFGEDGVTMGASEACFMQADFGLVEVFRFAF